MAAGWHSDRILIAMRNNDRDDDKEENDARRVTTSLAGLALVLFLVVVCIFLAQKLTKMGEIQDCIMSGRTNCAPIEVPAR
jgi:hypothetical protein